MAAQLTTVAMLMMCLTCLHSAVGGEQQSTENIDGLREELRRMADVMMEVRPQTEEKMTTLSAAITRLEDKNDALEQNNLAMKHGIGALKQGIGALKQDNVALKQNNMAMKNDDMTMKLEIAALKQDNNILKTQVEGQNSVVGNLVGENSVIKQQIQDMLSDPRHDDESIQVAFSVVSHKDFGPVLENTIIPFEITYVNVGSCWNPDENTFQAMVRGVYMFIASMRAYDINTGSTYCDIVHTPASGGQTIMATMYAYGGYYNDAANSAILELEQGDVVYVQLRSNFGGHIYSDSSSVLSTFSGFLLFE